MPDGLMAIQEPIFVDTWGWVALGHRRDQYHPVVKSVFTQLRANQIKIHTSDYVLDEVITLLFKREILQEAVQFIEGILQAEELGQVQVHRVTPERFQALVL